MSLLFISFCSLSYIQLDNNPLIYFGWIFFSCFDWRILCIVGESFVFLFRCKASLRGIYSLTIRHLGSSAKSLFFKLFPVWLETQKNCLELGREAGRKLTSNKIKFAWVWLLWFMSILVDLFVCLLLFNYTIVVLSVIVGLIQKLMP